MGENEDLLENKAAVVKDRKGNKFSRLIPSYEGIRIWGGKSAVARTKADGQIDAVRSPLGKFGRRISRRRMMRRNVDPEITAEKCLNHFGLPIDTTENVNFELVLYDEDGNDATPLVLAHEISVSGYYVDGNPFSVSCLVDLDSMEVLKAWEDFNAVVAGGNQLTKQRTYGVDYPPLRSKTVSNGVCQLTTPEGIVNVFDNKNERTLSFSGKSPIQYSCPNGYQDAINNGYGPAHDAFFNLDTTVSMLMHKDWGNLDTPEQIVGTGKVNAAVHFGSKFENAFFSKNDNALYLGDGASFFYPTTTCLDVIAHEVGHSLTNLRSGLAYTGESGCINEAFSDLVAEATENFAFGKNDFKIGQGCLKNGGTLRNMKEDYLNYPGYFPGQCKSLEQLLFYFQFFCFLSIAVHVCSCIYNRGFFRLSELWGISKTFQVVLAANTLGWSEVSRKLSVSFS